MRTVTHPSSPSTLAAAGTPRLARRRWLKNALVSSAGIPVAAALSAPLQACGGSEDCGTDPGMKGFPAFFAQAPVLRMQDRLAEFLGAAEQGIIEYRYVDAVRLAGHSCPTVAGAYLMTIKGIGALYGSALPERGGIDVLMRDGREDGVTGVIAAIATLLTGAAAETGFPGMGKAHRFTRKNLLSYGNAMQGELALRRRDNGQAVQVRLDASVTPWSEAIKPLMPRAIAGQATPDELRRFGALWQARVKAMLIDHADDPRLVQVSPWTATA